MHWDDGEAPLMQQVSPVLWCPEAEGALGCEPGGRLEETEKLETRLVSRDLADGVISFSREKSTWGPSHFKHYNQVL